MLLFFYGVSVSWFVLTFLDTIFKTCMFTPYIKALQVCGIEVKPLYISLHITRFNKTIYQMGNWRPDIVKIWFNMGVLTTCIIIVPAVILCIFSIFKMLRSSTGENFDSSLLLPIIPGYNIPASHFIYYILILLLCSGFHELGHALAASREGVNLEECGLALFGIVSYAFVNFRADHISMLHYAKQLRIFCAGVWHNIVLTIIALLLYSSRYFVFWPMFSTGNGVTVIDIYQNSPFNNPGGLEIGDHIYEIGNCKVTDQLSWLKCLKYISDNLPQGFCAPDDARFELMYAVRRQKCQSLPEYRSFHIRRNTYVKDICLKGRSIIDYSSCSETSSCGQGFVCIYPVLASKLDRFIVIKRHYKESILYEGPISNVGVEVEVSNFIPRLKSLSASYPEFVATLLEYIVMFSSGLALINLLPISYLDGDYIISNLVHMGLEKYIKVIKRHYIIKQIKTIGSILSILLVLVALKIIFLSY